MNNKKGFKKITLLLAIIMPVIFFMSPISVSADQYDDYANSQQYNNVISNDHFLDINSMTVSDIQSFLENNGSYLAGYSDNGRSAAQIIYDAAHGRYDAAGTWHEITIDESTGTINPEVILVFLQKEQSLITSTVYDEWKMTASMGYFCYSGVTGDDNDNNCKDIYEGFTKQVENGAWQLRYNYEAAAKDSAWWDTYYPSATQFRVGNTATMGTSRTPPDGYSVTFSNQATASCYRYTPYVFFGNYNVWNLFYNIYNFDDGGAANIGANDTSEYCVNTYNSTINITGGKESILKTYLEDALIADSGTTSWNFSKEFPIGETAVIVYYRDADGNKVAGKKIVCKRHKMSDINFDGAIDISDLAIFAENWGKTGPSEPLADFNSDNVVDISDLAIIADNWGK